MKCYKKLFTKEGLIKNIGHYVLSLIILLIFILCLIFKIKGYSKLIQQIDKITRNKVIDDDKNKKKGNQKRKSCVKNLNDDKKQNNKRKSYIASLNDIKEPNKKKENNKRKSRILNLNDNKNENKKRKSYIPSLDDNKKQKIKISDNKKNKKRYSINIMKTNDEITVEKSNKNSELKNSRIKINIQKSNNNFLNNNNYSKEGKDLLNNNNIFNSKDNNIFRFNDYEINNLTYEEALKYDKRTYFQFYFSLLKTKQLIIFTFYTKNDYNSRIIKIILFLFSFSLYLTINALFFNDSTIHKIYEDKGSFNFIYQVPNIFYSSIITSIINIIIKYLSLSEKSILELKKEEKNPTKKKSETINYLKTKFIIFFVLIFIFLIFFWYYLSCFCAIYKNTQIHMIKDSSISFGLSMVYPFLLNLIPGIFRIPSLINKKEYMYSISKIIQLI